MLVLCDTSASACFALGGLCKQRPPITLPAFSEVARSRTGIEIDTKAKALSYEQQISLKMQARLRMRTPNNMVEDRRLLTRLGSPLRVVQLGGCDRVMASHGDVFPGVYYCQEKYSMDR